MVWPTVARICRIILTFVLINLKSGVSFYDLRFLVMDVTFFSAQFNVNVKTPSVSFFTSSGVLRVFYVCYKQTGVNVSLIAIDLRRVPSRRSKQVLLMKVSTVRLWIIYWLYLNVDEYMTLAIPSTTSSFYILIDLIIASAHRNFLQYYIYRQCSASNYLP